MLSISISKDRSIYCPLLIEWESLHQIVSKNINFTVCQFKENHRIKENWIPNTQQLIVLDFDLLPFESPWTIKNSPLWKQFKCLVYSTKSHNIKKNGYLSPRFRVIFLIEKPFTEDYCIEKYESTYRSFCDSYIQQPDKACKDPSRSWAGNEGCEFEYYDGVYLNFHKYFKESKSVVKDEEEPWKRDSFMNRDTWKSRLKPQEIQQGDRNNSYFKKGMWFSRKGCSNEDIFEMFEWLDEQTGSPLPNLEKRNIIKQINVYNTKNSIRL